MHTDYKKIEDLLMRRIEISSEKAKVIVSERFYDWYNASLHGGKYKDLTMKIKEISESNYLVSNITVISFKEERIE